MQPLVFVRPGRLEWREATEPKLEEAPPSETTAKVIAARDEILAATRVSQAA